MAFESSVLENLKLHPIATGYRSTDRWRESHPVKGLSRSLKEMETAPSAAAQR
jgi:hypothetical protein